MTIGTGLRSVPGKAYVLPNGESIVRIQRCMIGTSKVLGQEITQILMTTVQIRNIIQLLLVVKVYLHTTAVLQDFSVIKKLTVIFHYC